MGRIFISAGHGGRDPGSVVGKTTEAQEMILLRDQVVPKLQLRGFEVLSVPDDLSSSQTIQWINSRTRPNDVALEIYADASSNPDDRGATAFYIANNTERKNHAELLLLALIQLLPQLPNRGAKPDTPTGIGRISFCRDTTLPAILLEVGFLSNPDDRYLLQNQRPDMALGIADGLAAWSRTVSGNSGDGSTYPAININFNNQTHGEQGILVNSNAYIPLDLEDQLGIDLTTATNVRRLQYQGVVYVQAIALRDYNISVGWDSANRTVIICSISLIPLGQIDQIMGVDYTSEEQLKMFINANNEKALKEFPDLPKLYRDEASIEGVNHDIAFSQMCVETNYLRFDGHLKAIQNNFGGLGDVGGTAKAATFPSARLGVRAHIQQLKAYASKKPLVQEQVSPQFRFIDRGNYPLVGQMSVRWSADPHYGDKIMAVLRRLYKQLSHNDFA